MLFFGTLLLILYFFFIIATITLLENEERMIFDIPCLVILIIYFAELAFRIYG